MKIKPVVDFPDKPMMMVKKVLYLLILISTVIIAQKEKEYSEYKNKYAFDPVLIVDRQGVLSRALFLDLEGDSLRLLINSKVTMLALSSIKFFKMDSQVRSRDNLLSFGIAGAFFAQLLLRKQDTQADRFIQSEGLWNHIVVGSLGAVAGGLIGLGFDRSGNEKEMEYDLDNPGDVLKLRRDILYTTNETRINFYYEISKVYSRTDPSARQASGNYYNYDNVMLNVFRSIRLTYNINPRFETGITIYSVAEPNLRYQSNSQYNYSTEEMTNKVYGYYATAFYDPLGFQKEYPVLVKAGIGAGFATIDYTISGTTSVMDPVKFTTVTTFEFNRLEKTVVSAFAALELRYLPSSKVSVALTGDYIYIPEKTLPSNLPGEGEKLFGNFSLGLTLGLHF
jgi:hypothetical protein